MRVGPHQSTVDALQEPDWRAVINMLSPCAKWSAGAVGANWHLDCLDCSEAMSASVVDPPPRIAKPTFLSENCSNLLLDLGHPLAPPECKVATPNVLRLSCRGVRRSRANQAAKDTPRGCDAPTPQADPSAG